jgi:hypothetical protein
VAYTTSREMPIVPMFPQDIQRAKVLRANFALVSTFSVIILVVRKQISPFIELLVTFLAHETVFRMVRVDMRDQVAEIGKFLATH